MKNNICDKQKCTGCSACMNVCARQAISMRPDDLGFLYPQISESLCVDCGLCSKVCPVNMLANRQKPLECYAATVKGLTELYSCASGGAATAIGRYVIEQGGVVYGCCGTDVMRVHHIRVTDIASLDLLKGSKYVQSEIGLTFSQVKDDLKEGRLVLFVGTPCQVAGLLGYLQKPYCNLVTADLVCHGVPSQQLLNDNLLLYKKAYGLDYTKHTTLAFRKKRGTTIGNMIENRISFGWFLMNQPKENTKEFSLDYKDDLYMYGFLRGLFFRECCYSCRYACPERVADFTLSDFWGLGKDAGFPEGDGVSAVLVNNEKAARLFETIKQNLNCAERTVEEAVKGNGQLQSPSKRNLLRELFVKLYTKKGFEYAASKALRLQRVSEYIRIPRLGIRTALRKVFKYSWIYNARVTI